MTRRLLALAAAALVGTAAALRLPRGALEDTLVILPLATVGLWEIGRWARHHGGRSTPPLVAAGEVSAAAVLLLLARGGGALPLPLIDRVLAGGLLLLLFHRLARLLLALRPVLGRRLPARPPAVFFWLPLVAYAAILPWSTAQRPPDGDEPYYLLIAHSLAYDGDTDLANNYAAADWRRFMARRIEPQPGDPVGSGGAQYSRHNAALPLVLTPAYRVAGKTGALAVMAILTAALVWATLRLARHYGRERPGEALLAYGLLAFSPPLLLYSHQVWIEVPAALLLVISLDQILTARDEGDGGPRRWLAIGLTLLALPLLKLRFVLLTGPLLVLALLVARRQRQLVLRRWLALAALLLAAGAAILFTNWIRFGNPLKYRPLATLTLHEYAATDFLKGFIGLSWDCGFGLFASAPVWMLLLPAALLLGVRRHPLLSHLALLGLPYLIFVAPRLEWYGGWSPPFRYALVLLPLLALALVPLLGDRRRVGARALQAGLAASTLALAVLWLAEPGWTYNLADGANHLLSRLAQALGADVARLFPSSIRPRPATWIWPPLSILAVGGLWWWPRRRGGGRIWGLTAVLGLAACGVHAALTAPTRTVEVEDRQVVKEGGRLFPARWVTARPRFRGGWVIGEGDAVSAPLIPGGGRVVMAIDLELIPPVPTPVTLEILAGDRELASWRATRPGRWQTVVLGPFDWPAGEELVLRARGGDTESGSLAVDKVRLWWE